MSGLAKEIPKILEVVTSPQRMVAVLKDSLLLAKWLFLTESLLREVKSEVEAEEIEVVTNVDAEMVNELEVEMEIEVETETKIEINTEIELETDS